MLLTLLAALALSQDAPPAERALRACLGKPDAERLACFDAAAALLVPASGAADAAAPLASAAPAPPSVDTAPPPASAPAAPIAAAPSAAPAPAAPAFGLRAERPDETLRAAVAEISLDRYGKATVTLADGQVWRQVSSDNVRLSRSKAKKAEQATIKRAALGSYRMTVVPADRTIRVKRVR